MSEVDFVPPSSGATGPYWIATRDQRLVLQWCRSCERPVHHPREACPGCLGTDLEWRDSSGTGAVHAMSIHYRPFEGMSAEDCPYAVAFVDLDDGVRFLANLTADTELETVNTGDRVSLRWRPVGDGYHLPVFHAGQR